MVKDELDSFEKVLCELWTLKKKKAYDYRNSWKILGLDGVYYQIASKFVRLWNLRHNDPKNESLRDTLKDMSIYCLMAIQLIDENDTDDKIKELLNK